MECEDLLEGTELASAKFELVKAEVGETDWILCRVEEREKELLPHSSPNYRRFESFGGALNLPDLIKIFRTWAEAKP
jgi:hypothetical protein